jgi:polyhydroxybutyrate depolymerase
MRGEISSGGIKRSFHLYVPPAYDPAVPIPLVLMLHGHGTTGRNMEVLTHVSSVAEAAGFIIAYPDGINKGWNDGRPAFDNGIDDVRFISDLISLLESQYDIDPTRIYATGMSQGGFMCYRLACEMAGRLAAVSTVAATLSENLAAGCRPARPVPVCIVHGTADPFVPYKGGPVGRRTGRGIGLSVENTVAFWVGVDGCDGEPVVTRIAPAYPRDPTRITRIAYLNGREGSEVILYRIEGGGHAWPGGYQYLPVRFIGRGSSQMDAGGAIWEFFERHSRKG